MRDWQNTMVSRHRRHGDAQSRFAEGSHRGGLLTMGSVLKVTANGTTTSPIIRGAWVLERILGTPPPKPPADVAAIEPDIRGATTIREQLAKHRTVESCASCHRQIDPPGFALESFDVIGGWREHYRPLANRDKSMGAESAFGTVQLLIQAINAGWQTLSKHR